jgi:uncharacterized protein YukE
MGADYLDLDPTAVAGAGNSTAATSGNWQSWGHEADTSFHEAASVVHDGGLSAAFGSYAATWNPRIQGLAIQVDALGRNTTSAANTMVNADGTATAQQRPVLDTVATGNRSALSRPISL